MAYKQNLEEIDGTLAPGKIVTLKFPREKNRDEGPSEDCSRLSFIIIELRGGKNPDKQEGEGWEGCRLPRQNAGKEGTGTKFST